MKKYCSNKSSLIAVKLHGVNKCAIELRLIRPSTVVKDIADGKYDRNLQRTDRSMERAMCGVQLNDRKC